MNPFRFTTVLKTPLWGGTDIVQLKGLKNYATVGESWEISAVSGNETVVKGGPYAGMTLSQLIEKLGADFVGAKNLERFGANFPILVKFLSTAAKLSIQLHPDDAMAQKEEGQPFGKNECWYVVKTTADAELYCGFQQPTSLETYEQLMQQGRLTTALAHYRTQRGDAFYIPSGQIHCIGAGNFLIEVQQTSDTTYRVYDFERRDAAGQLRELHTEKARRALKCDLPKFHHTHYDAPHNERVKLEQHPEFSTNVYHVDRAIRADFSSLDSFVILVAFEGAAVLTDHEGYSTTLSAGETLLFPATTQFVDIRPLDGQLFSCIETYVE